MKVRNLIFAIVLSFLVQGFALANRQLDQGEINQILRTLTSEPRRTWILSGTIKATHREYKSSNGYVIDSNVIVKYNGDRFYWEINIDSHTKQDESRESRENIDLNVNRERVFVWDGERYTVYFKSGNQAIVTEAPTDIPVVVNGPLTAGVAPWGNGLYTYANLSAGESSAVVDSQGLVHLTILTQVNELRLEMGLVLDPTKNYAVLSHSLSDGGISSIVKTYRDYELVSGRWIPTTIVIDQYDHRKQSPELLSRNEWKLTSVSTGAPSPDSFSVPYVTGTLVKYKPSIINKPLWYHHSNDVDIDSLLCDRLKSVLTGEMREQNCATTSMKHVLVDLGKDVDDSDLAGLISEPNEGTSLYAMREFAQGLGFHCLAGKTNLETLKNLNGTQAILHLPEEDHYVILAHIDDEYAWLIDLDRNKFLYREKLEKFDLDFGETTALLVSKSPLLLTGSFVRLTDRQSQEIVGGFPNFSCTKVIQEDDIIGCPSPKGMTCGGCYYSFELLCGCVPDPNGGDCSGSPTPSYLYDHCYYSEAYGYCVGDGDTYARFMRGCECELE
ncbi:MAG: cysteine peptidase family C39 domain-containing protein [Planctomycetota bacterium]|jgi:hypothetical protein